MKVLHKIFASLALVATVSACNLDLNPKDKITYGDPSELFSDYPTAEKFANGLNGYFRATTQGVNSQASDTQTDMFNAVLDFGNNGGPVHTMGSSFTASDYDTKAVWDYNFKLITQTNSFLANIDKVVKTDLSDSEVEDLEQWKAQALFYRAYAYFNLASLFCVDYEPATAESELGLPLINYPDMVGKPARATLKETFEFITSDIAAAFDLMHVRGKVLAIEPTEDALTALSARVNLAMHNYADAYADANILVTCGRYSLATSVNALTAEFVTQNGTETILGAYASLSETPLTNGYYINSYKQVLDGADTYGIYYLPNDNLVSLYETKDARYSVFLNNIQVQIQGNLYQPLVFAKYKGNPALTTSPTYACVTAPRVIALPEMYLIAAEAAFQNNQDALAEAALNALQSARGASETTGTLENIKNEWAKETVGEGMRLQCLKRWHDGFNGRPAQDGMEGAVMTGSSYTGLTVSPTDFKLVWPIPYYEITTNLSLVQNQGW